MLAEGCTWLRWPATYTLIVLDASSSITSTHLLITSHSRYYFSLRRIYFSPNLLSIQIRFYLFPRLETVLSPTSFIATRTLKVLLTLLLSIFLSALFLSYPLSCYLTFPYNTYLPSVPPQHLPLHLFTNTSHLNTDKQHTSYPAFSSLTHAITSSSSLASPHPLVISLPVYDLQLRASRSLQDIVLISQGVADGAACYCHTPRDEQH